MARKYYIVLIERPHQWLGGDYRGQFFVDEKDTNTVSIFTDRTSAEQWAVEQAKQNAGKDIQIFEAIDGFYAPPGDVVRKTWSDGKYIPV